MELISIVFFCITLLYTIVILGLIVGDFKLPTFHFEASNSKHEFSIIIPFRNEEKHLPFLLNSLQNLVYPTSLFEVFFVNDESTDNSVFLIHDALSNTKINYQLIENHRISGSPKKDALQAAIVLSNYEYIITTDADCILPKSWLNSFSSFLQKQKAEMIVAPVEIICQNSFLQRFQALEVLSLQTATKGGFGWSLPFMANGANLCFSKKQFKELNGYRDNNHLASGDDIFLLEKFILNNKNIRFLKSKSATVKTFPESSWKEVIQQRVRWASKSKHYSLKRAKWIGSIVFFMNTIFVISIPLLLIRWLPISTSLLIIMAKLIIDFCSMLNQIKKENYHVLFIYPLAAFLYPFFSVLITLKALMGNYNWKGRSFRA